MHEIVGGLSRLLLELAAILWLPGFLILMIFGIVRRKPWRTMITQAFLISGSVAVPIIFLVMAFVVTWIFDGPHADDPNW